MLSLYTRTVSVSDLHSLKVHVCQSVYCTSASGQSHLLCDIYIS
jgi:hypothetical protein